MLVRDCLLFLQERKLWWYQAHSDQFILHGSKRCSLHSVCTAAVVLNGMEKLFSFSFFFMDLWWGHDWTLGWFDSHQWHMYRFSICTDSTCRRIVHISCLSLVSVEWDVYWILERSCRWESLGGCDGWLCSGLVCIALHTLNIQSSFDYNSL